MDKKLNPTDHVILSGERDAALDSNHEEDDGWGNVQKTDEIPTRNLEGEGVPKWYNMIDYKKIHKFMPKLRIMRGSKAKFTITIFSEISQVAQSIFERNKGFFRHRAQVDSMAYYIGIKFMECLFLVIPGYGKSKLSSLLETQEKENQIYDDMAIIKEKFKKDVERYISGFFDSAELNRKINAYLKTFDDKESKETMKKVLTNMIEANEEAKAKERMRKKEAYKESKLRVVEND